MPGVNEVSSDGYLLKNKPVCADKTGHKGRLASSSLRSSSRRHLAHFLPALPAVSQPVSSDFPEKHEEAGSFTCGQHAHDVAVASGLTPRAATRVH